MTTNTTNLTLPSERAQFINQLRAQASKTRNNPENINHEVNYDLDTEACEMIEVLNCLNDINGLDATLFNNLNNAFKLLLIHNPDKAESIFNSHTIITELFRTIALRSEIIKNKMEEYDSLLEDLEELDLNGTLKVA